MINMLGQFNHSITIKTLSEFVRAMEIPIVYVKEIQRKANNDIVESEMKEYTKLFEWMNYIANSYKPIEEAEENAIYLNSNHLEYLEKNKYSLSPSTQLLVEKYQLTEDEIEGIRVTYAKLEIESKKNIETFINILKQNAIPSPFAEKIASCLIKNREINLNCFVEIIGLFSKKNMQKERNVFLFNMLCEESSIKGLPT